eukprot:754200-Hanusia_phi.AAC.11
MAGDPRRQLVAARDWVLTEGDADKFREVHAGLRAVGDEDPERMESAVEDEVGEVPPPRAQIAMFQPSMLQVRTQKLVSARRVALRSWKAVGMRRVRAVGDPGTCLVAAQTDVVLADEVSSWLDVALLVTCGEAIEGLCLVEGDPFAGEEGLHAQVLVYLRVEGMAMHGLDPLVGTASHQDVERPRLIPQV